MVKSPKPKNPAVYVRISDDREGESKGVKRQLEDCRALVERREWPEPVEYNDNDVSAWKRGTVRPQYRQMLADIAGGTVDAVVVYDTDRLYRQPRELEEFFDVCDAAGVTELASVSGDIDLASTDGKLMARMKGAVAAKESDDKSRRIKRKALELARDGKVGGGGTRPFGFEDDRVTVRESEAVHTREAADRVFADDSIRAICFNLNERGITTTTGGPWVPVVLRRMLMSGRISGQREHRGEIVGDAEWGKILEDGKWGAIISKEDGNRLRSILSDPARRKNQQVRRYLLHGMLRCGRCGEPLTSRPRQDRVRRYICAKRPGEDACGKLAILAEPLEDLVTEMVATSLDGPELSQALAARNGDSEDVHQRVIDEASERLDELGRLYGEERIGASEWLAARAPIEDRLTKSKAALARSNGTGALAEFIGQGSALRGSWGGLSLDRRRAIIGAVIDHVEIGPGRRGYNRFDGSRVAPLWKV